MKPISEWTDTELSVEEIQQCHSWDPLAEHLAAEVLRLRALWRAAEDELIVRSQAAEAEIENLLRVNNDLKFTASDYRDAYARHMTNCPGCAPS